MMRTEFFFGPLRPSCGLSSILIQKIWTFFNFSGAPAHANSVKEKGHTRCQQRIMKSQTSVCHIRVIWFACASLFFLFVGASKAITAFCYIYLHFITRTRRIYDERAMCDGVVVAISCIAFGEPLARQSFTSCIKLMNSSKKNWDHVYLIRAVFRCLYAKWVSFFFSLSFDTSSPSNGW